MKDPRYLKLRKGLEQLSTPQLRKILNHPDPMVFDTWNFEEATGRY
jgi:hypothetical protein